MNSARSGCVAAIPTKYKGYKFRSRLEARWAVYFDNAGIEWEYEKEGYVVGGVPYLPDFWLPQVNMWAKVKAQEFTKEEEQKLIDLVLLTEFGALELVGVPDFKPYWGVLFREPAYGETEPYTDWCDFILDNRYFNEKRFFMSTGYENSKEGILEFQDYEYSDYGSRDIRQAVNAARSARFEFLEQV